MNKGFKVVYVDQPHGHKSKSHHHHSNHSSQQQSQIQTANANTNSSSSTWSSSSSSTTGTSNTNIQPKYENVNGAGDAGSVHAGVCTVSSMPSSSVMQNGDNMLQQSLMQQNAQLNEEYIRLNNFSNFGEINIENVLLPENCCVDDLRKFEELYRHHCEVSII
jgi:hypothetical protein